MRIPQTDAFRRSLAMPVLCELYASSGWRPGNAGSRIVITMIIIIGVAVNKLEVFWSFSREPLFVRQLRSFHHRTCSCSRLPNCMAKKDVFRYFILQGLKANCLRLRRALISSSNSKWLEFVALEAKGCLRLDPIALQFVQLRR